MNTPEGLGTGELADPTWSTSASEAADCRSPTIRQESAATYIADIATELAALARGAKLDILAYLLDIAQLEAASNARRLKRASGAR